MVIIFIIIVSDLVITFVSDHSDLLFLFYDLNDLVIPLINNFFYLNKIFMYWFGNFKDFLACF